jgi:hypothetical protein
MIVVPKLSPSECPPAAHLWAAGDASGSSWPDTGCAGDAPLALSGSYTTGGTGIVIGDATGRAQVALSALSVDLAGGDDYTALSAITLSSATQPGGSGWTVGVGGVLVGVFIDNTTTTWRAFGATSGASGSKGTVTPGQYCAVIVRSSGSTTAELRTSTGTLIWSTTIDTGTLSGSLALGNLPTGTDRGIAGTVHAGAVYDSALAAGDRASACAGLMP